MDIHGYGERLIVALDKLKDKGVSSKNTKLIKDFSEYCNATGISKGRILKYVYTLQTLSSFLKKDFDVAEREDIQRVVSQIENKDYSAWTKKDFKVCLKKFYSWLKNCEPKEYPEEVKWIKTTIKKKDIKLPSKNELLSEDDIMKMVKAADYSRDKAFIMLLYETGARIGEIASMKIKDISFDKFGAIINIDGKTGQRTLRVISSVPLLSSWIDDHPGNDNPNSPLWILLRSKEVKQLKYRGLSIILKRVSKKAGIRKKIYPHLFRHSRATFLANHLREAQMKQYFGWEQGSDMASVYIHMSGRDLEEPILELNGMKKKEDDSVKTKLVPKKCPRCKVKSDASADFCNRCGMPLTPKAAMSIEESIEAYPQIVSKADDKLRKDLLNLAKKKLSDREIDRIARRVAGLIRK